jgi:Vitamin B12 dependent methionine synthase, activation domain
MTESVKITTDKIIPLINDITLQQGIPKGSVIKDNIKSLIDESLTIFRTEARPSSIISEISKDEFNYIFTGEGNNENEAPLKMIYPQAEHLVIFAVTMGAEISQIVNKLFNKNDFALGSMVDTIASLAADKAVEILENYITEKFVGNKLTNNSLMTLSYSPGYCGWNIDAQKKLFSFLQPQQIGISLNESCLMIPLKSVTGVLVYGNKSIHQFDNSFSFCFDCRAQSCIERIERVLNY